MGDRASGDDTPRESAERKVVTVLAVDVDEPVEGFDERDPEDVRALLARHVERVRTVVERFGGTVEHGHDLALGALARSVVTAGAVSHAALLLP